MSHDPIFPPPPTPPGTLPCMEPGGSLVGIPVPGTEDVIMVPAGFQQPSGPEGYVPFNVDQDSLIPLDDPALVCAGCAYGMIVRAAAAVRNRKPDGSPFCELTGWCLRSEGHPFSFDRMRPIACTQLKPRAKSASCTECDCE